MPRLISPVVDDLVPRDRSVQERPRLRAVIAARKTKGM